MPWVWMLPICSTMRTGEGGALTPPTTAQLRNRVMRTSWALRSRRRTCADLVPRTGPAGLTLEQYAAAKGAADRLPQDPAGCRRFTYDRKPAVRIPYLGEGGEEIAVRFRIALSGDRFRWKSGTKPCLYGLNRLAEAKKAGQVVLVEGESDCHTLWFHGIPALGIPGAANWREERDARHLDGIETIYVVVEPDRGGDAVRQWLSRSTIRHRAKLVSLPAKDPSALHLEGPTEFSQALAGRVLGRGALDGGRGRSQR